MRNNNHHGPTLTALLRRTLTTGLGALRNRGELLIVEIQEEKARVVNVILRGVLALFLAMMTALLLTGTIIFLMPQAYRLYAAAAFTVLYLAGTIWAVTNVRVLLNKVPFSETAAQFSKDRELTETFE